MLHSGLDLESVTGAAVALQASPRHSLNFYIWVHWYYLVYVHVLCIILLKGRLECLARLWGASFFCNLRVCLAVALEYNFIAVILCLSLILNFLPFLGLIFIDRN
jgi:hypothetical protein